MTRMVELREVPHGPNACKKCRRVWYSAPAIYRFAGSEPTSASSLRATYTPYEGRVVA